MRRNENDLIFEQYIKINEAGRIGSRGSRAPRPIDHDYSKFDKNGGHYNVGDRVYVEYDPNSYDVDIEMRGTVTKVSIDGRGEYEYMFLQDGDTEEEGPYDPITLRPVPFDEPDNDNTKDIEESGPRRDSSMFSADNIYINEDPVNFVEFSPLNNEELGEVNAEQSTTVKRKFGAKAQISSGAETGDGSDGVYSKITVNGKQVATILSGYEYGGTDIYHYINSMDTGIERREHSPITKSDYKYLKSLKTRGPENTSP